MDKTRARVAEFPNNSYKTITNMAWVRSRLCRLQKRVHSTQPQVIKSTSCLPMAGGSLWVLQLLPPLKLVAKFKFKSHIRKYPKTYHNWNGWVWILFWVCRSVDEVNFYSPLSVVQLELISLSWVAQHNRQYHHTMKSLNMSSMLVH